MKIICTISILLICNGLFAQNPYFQQEVNYKIAVALNDSMHTITGNIEIQYTNNAPNQIDSIYFHLWGNAFQNRTTAFAKQKLRENSTEFYFADAEDLGGYTDLNFTVDSQKSI